MKTILIIEDDSIVRNNLCDILEMEDFRPVLTPNGSAGLAAAKSESPDLILCDVLMPGLDGHQVLTALRADAGTARIPFIFLTAKGEGVDVRAGMKLGADDYLIKPVKAVDLLDAIAARLERAQQQSGFNADFSSAAPLERLGLSPREAEILLWVAQGKTNFEISVILGITVATVKKHLEKIYPKLGVESRNAATLKTLETLSRAD
jgi:DNA-binding NarL/FixJ family response regulator